MKKHSDKNRLIKVYFFGVGFFACLIFVMGIAGDIEMTTDRPIDWAKAIAMAIIAFVFMLFFVKKLNKLDK